MCSLSVSFKLCLPGMASSWPLKHPRNSSNASKKKKICFYNQAHPKATYDGIQAHFEKDWGFKVGCSTIGDVWRVQSEWLKVEDDSKVCRTRTPKNQSVEDSEALAISQHEKIGWCKANKYF